MIYPIVVCSLELAVKLGMKPLPAQVVVVPLGSFPVIAKGPQSRTVFLHWPAAYVAAQPK